MRHWAIVLISLLFCLSCTHLREVNDSRPKLEDSDTFEQWVLQGTTEHSPRIVVFQYQNRVHDDLHVIRINGEVRLQVFAFRDQSYCIKYPGKPCQEAQPHLARLLLTPEAILSLEKSP